MEIKSNLDVALFRRHGTNPTAAFLQKLCEKHDFSEVEVLTDQFGYQTALSRVGLSSQVRSTDRNHIEKCFHTLKMRLDSSQDLWVSS